MKMMERFLDDEAVRRSKARVRAVQRLWGILAGLALALFVLLCLLTRTGNARLMLVIAIAAMIAAGWGLICLWLFAVEPARAEAQHLASLAGAEKQVREGRFFLTGDSFRIPKSVRVRKVRLETCDETLSLNISAKLAGRMPSSGSLVRAETARKFITAVEVLEPGTEQAALPRSSPLKRFSRAFGRFFLPAVIWAVLAAMLTGFVFNQITDTAPENKIVICADCEVQNLPALAEKLENALGGSVRMVKIHPFSYAMFDSVRLRQADLYLVPDSRLADYPDWFLPEEGPLMFDPASGLEIAGAYFLYVPEGGTPEPFRLYTGAASVHLEDGLARRTAELLLSVNDAEKEDTP